MSDEEFIRVANLRGKIAKLANEYTKIDRMPFDTGLGDLLYPSELNMLEAIASGKGKTVTELCEYFGITKGAVSQTVTKLITRGYVRKEKSTKNYKEVWIDLTDKGGLACERHEEFHRRMDASMVRLVEGIDPMELEKFGQMLDIVIRHIDSYNQITDRHI